MLLNITVENFRSYNEAQTLSLIASNDSDVNSVKVGDFMVRKSAVIYGANGSGKSNIIKAGFALIDILANDINSSNSGMVYSPFFKNKKPTQISIDFTILEQIYTYSLSYDNEYIYLEELLTGDGVLIFRRKYVQNKYEYTIPSPQLILSDEQLEVADGLLKQIQLSTTSKRLFLRQLVENNCKKLELIKTSLLSVIIRQNPYDFMGKPYSVYTDLSFAANYFQRNNKEADVISALHGIGVNINNLKVIYNNENPQPGDMVNGVRELLSRYTVAGKDCELDFKNDESDGTVKFYSYLALIDYVIQNDGMLVIDELETHFHPLLVEEIIKLVHQSDSKAQIIFTTHSSELLSERIFERDQIYFAAKNKNQATELYSLAEFTDLEDSSNLQAKYLTGNFGAIPYLRGVFINGQSND